MKSGYRLQQFLLLTGDALAYLGALWLGLLARHLVIPTPALYFDHLPLFGGLFCGWLIINYINGLYDLGRFTERSHYRRLFEAAIIFFLISVLALYAGEPGLTPKTILFLTVLFGYSLSTTWRMFYYRVIVQHTLHTRLIILGHDPEVAELIRLTKQHPEKGYQVVAIFDPRRQIGTTKLEGIDVYTAMTALRAAITNHKANVIAAASSVQNDEDVVRELYELLFWPVKVTDLSSLYETITGRVPPSAFSETWFLRNVGALDAPGYRLFRLALDGTATLAMTIILALFFPLIALVIKLTSKGPVFFSQQRVGRGGTLFTMHKFRTMYVLAADGSAETNGAQFATKDDARVTPIGRFLRRTRLDELPQAINMLRGEISLVGPRPERPEFVRALASSMPYYALRHVVRPGITGWAAINQNYTDNLETTLQKLQYDLFYIKNRSALLDIAILLRTVNVVVRMLGQ